MNKKSNKKSASAVSIIGGADGPTSIFLAGSLNSSKERKGKQAKHCLSKEEKRMQRELEKVKKKTRPVSHSFLELEEYMKKKYGAVKIEPVDSMREDSIKASLVYRYHPELVDLQYPDAPKEELSFEMMENFFSLQKAWMDAAAKIPDKVLHFDIKQYRIKLYTKRGIGCLDVFFESTHSYFEITSSFSGRDKDGICHFVIKDLYSYYGVEEKDIKENSERYRILCGILSYQDSCQKHCYKRRRISSKRARKFQQQNQGKRKRMIKSWRVIAVIFLFLCCFISFYYSIWNCFFKKRIKE